MDSVSNVPSQTISIGMVSGARYCLSEIFLHEETQLRKAQALRATAAGNFGGVSTGIGFWGSPEWALGGALALGIVEGLASNAAAKKGMSQLEEAVHLMASAQKSGTYVPVRDIQNIEVPQPGLWRGVVKQTVLKSYAHSGEPFILACTVEEGVICLAWEKVESFLPPPILQLNDAQLSEQYGITFDGKHYWYESYRYDKLPDAIGYAKSVHGRL